MLFSTNILIDLVIFFIFSLTVLYVVVQYNYTYWVRKGVFSPKPSFPFGNIGKVIIGKEQIGVHLADIYNETKHHPYVGLFMLHGKALMINDLDLIKTMMVKDFQYFPDHGLGMNEISDPLSKHIFNMEGNAWKTLRTKLTPTFTSRKMKYMFNTMLNCSEELENYLEEQVKMGNEVDFKETLAKYGTDVIGSCAFGIETNSFKYPDADFRNMGKKFFDINFIKCFREILTLYAPSVVRHFHVRIVPKDVENFFRKTVDETIKYREENNTTRNDFLQILIDMKNNDELNGSGQSMSLLEITAQVFLFFIAGFETSSTTASYAIYELAKNKRVQDKLRDEIDRITKKHDGKLTYESILEMEYLTLVIEEALRMCPTFSILFRVCAKDYKIPNSNVVIEKGTRIIFPIFGIHRDPAIHADPNNFNPERYLPQNKINMHPFSSLPFGEGPRICIGIRFGMMQARLGIIKSISKYEVSLLNDSNQPVKFEPVAFLLKPAINEIFKVTRRRI
ncbi:cytochrome P450 6a2-like [Arctopsyche grandis]|uniref:cytochrome P450 6a2-like n=1 Tax=Arctopsyche grandis TaxID=121162 RepID=UPI00406D6CD2